MTISSQERKNKHISQKQRSAKIADKTHAPKTSRKPGQNQALHKTPKKRSAKIADKTHAPKTSRKPGQNQALHKTPKKRLTQTLRGKIPPQHGSKYGGPMTGHPEIQALRTPQGIFWNYG